MKHSLNQQIKYLKNDKKISFNYMSEASAKTVLRQHTYYYKVTCFRKNFTKDKDGYYSNLDFAALNDLATIDMRLRYLLIQLTLDLEHALKTKIIESITLSSEDGYSIITEFDNFEKQKFITKGKNVSDYKDIQEMYMRRLNPSEYDYHLINTYHASNPHKKPLPIWVFLEKVSFGGLVKFINFYVKYKKPNYKVLKTANELLKYSKRIRDAAAHNRPILINIGNNTHAGIIKTRISQSMENYIIDMTSYSKGTPEYLHSLKLLKNTKVHDLLCVFFLHRQYVGSIAIKDIRQNEINSLLTRIQREKHLYKDHQNLIQIYIFFEKVLFFESENN